VGQNILAAAALTLAISAALAVLAKTIASAFGVSDTISLADFFVISVVGGVLSSIVVLALTLGVAALSVRRGWDMDNVAAPLVTAAGDIVTLPALFLATYLLGISGVTISIAVLGAAAAVLALIVASRSRHTIIRGVVRESTPILLVAGAIDVVAGLTIEHRLESFLAYPVLLVLVPPFFEDTGALGSVLASRLSSKLHLGIIEPKARPQRAARDDFALIAILAVPVFVFVGLSADIVGAIFGYASPGALQIVAVSLIGGIIATSVAIGVAYYSSIATYRLGLDPDNYGVPIITSSMDLVGAIALVLAIIVVGIA
jgi:mgtE-like transporter